MLVTLNYHAYIWEIIMVDEAIEDTLLSFHFYKTWILIKLNLYDYENDKFLYVEGIQVILKINQF